MADNVIGNLQILVGADLSGLQADLAKIPTMLAGVNSSVNATTTGLQAAGASAEEAGGHFEGMTETLVSLAEELGIAFGAYELLKSSLESYAEVQKAQIALTALTGDAEGAETAISGLRQMALSEGLDFPALVQADQRMVALGIDLAQIPPLMQAVADASAATGNAFDSTANSVERLALSGTAGARQLATLGLSLEDLAKALGTTSDQAAKAFKELDEASRVNVLIDALNKYNGVAIAAADSLAGRWQIAKTQVVTGLEAIGEAIAPVAVALLSAFSKVGEEIQADVDLLKKMVDAINTLGGAFSDTSFSKVMTMIGAAAGSVGLGPAATNQGGGSNLSTTQMIQQFLRGNGGEGGQTSTIPMPFSVQNSATAGTDPLIEALKDAQAQLSLVSQAYKMGAASADELGYATQRVNDAFVKLHPEFAQAYADALAQRASMETSADLLGATSDAMKVLGASIQSTAANGDTYVDSLDQINEKVQENFQSAYDYNEALKTEAVDLQQVAGLQQIMVDDIARSTDATDLLTDSMVNNSKEVRNAYQAIDQLDKQGFRGLIQSIPDATRLGGQFFSEVLLGIPDISQLQTKLEQSKTAYDQLAASGANNYQITEAGAAVLRNQIALYQQQGINTSELTIKLQQMNASLQQQPTLWATVQGAMLQVGNTLKTGLGQAIDGIIAGTTSIGDAFSRLGLQIVDVIVNTMIAKGVQMLLNSLAGVGGVLGSIGSALGGVVSASTGGAGGVLGTSVGSAGGAAGTISQVGAGIPSSGGGAGAASSTLATLGSVGSIVGAVAEVGAGITAGLQASTTNDHLFHIMSDTAYIKGYLADIHEYTHDTANNCMTTIQRLTDISGQLGIVDSDVQSCANNVAYFVGKSNDLLGQIVGLLMNGSTAAEVGFGNAIAAALRTQGVSA